MIRKRKPPLNDLTGQKFGHLEVLRMAQTEKSTRGTWRAICKCNNCGNSCYDADPSAIKRGYTKSCGCDKSRYNKTRGKNSKQFKGYEEISGKLWWAIKNRANHRGWELEIDIKYVWDLFVKQNRKCALSGLSLQFGPTTTRISETTASLDRIDSNKGYVKGNVQWVHKDINQMKSDFDENYFINTCIQIAKNKSYLFE